MAMSDTHPMRYLSERDLTQLVSPAALIAGIERGLKDLLAEQVVVHPRDHIAFDDNTLLTMPVVGAESFGTKVVSVHPANRDRGLPVINGLMTLFDRRTGKPRAIMNAAALTAQRTGAVGAIGLKYTTPPDLDGLGIVGCGVQGTWQALFACAVRPIRTIHFLEHSEVNAKRFFDTLVNFNPDLRLVRCRDSATLVLRSPAIITATTSTTPVLPDDRGLLENRHLLSIGSFRPNMQELPDAAYTLTDTVVVDSDVARHEVGDLINPLKSGRLRDDGLIHLAELVAGRKTVNTDTTTVFKSVGMALYDLYAAQIFHAAAETQGRGRALDL